MAIQLPTPQKFSKKLALTSILGGLVLTAVLLSFKMNIFEAALYDFRVRQNGPRLGLTDKSSPVVLIGIDDSTTESLDEFAPLKIARHVELLKIVGQAKPKAVAFLVNFNESLRDHTAQDANAAENLKVEALRFEAQGVKVLLGTEIAVTGDIIQPPYPLSTLPYATAMIHKDATVFSEDKVTRRAILSINGEKTFHALLAELISPRPAGFRYRGVYSVPEVNADYALINYRSPTQEGKVTFTTFSFKDVLAGNVAADAFTGKVVMIGTHGQSNSNDYLYTPFSRDLFTNPKLAVHAHIVETLANNDALVASNRWVDAAVTFVLTASIIWMVFSTSPVVGVGITAVLGLTYVAIAILLFRFSAITLNMAHPLLGIFFAYYVFVPYRLIMEYKTRGAYQRRHEVLMQVDELKRNFMSLITHDLKTPVARIQGMAEMLGRAGADASIVDAIVKSTEELNRFITSILELAKVETKNVKLQKTSKDVNRVVEDCVSKLEFEAGKRGIEISTDLEPLFPINVDVSLLSKIIVNLVDNAIKYSASGSQIKIASKESSKRKGFVEISVTDTGAGIAPNDIENLFSKFYRPQNDASMQNKGYGLGLYLSRYFAELHRGSLEVSSELGKGSTFTLYLPLDDADDEVYVENTGGAYV